VSDDESVALVYSNENVIALIISGLSDCWRISLGLWCRTFLTNGPFSFHFGPGAVQPCTNLLARLKIEFLHFHAPLLASVPDLLPIEPRRRKRTMPRWPLFVKSIKQLTVQLVGMPEDGHYTVGHAMQMS
jgi:hypothetical protein